MMMSVPSSTPGTAAVQPDPVAEVPSSSLLGKKAFVSGSSRGIGRAVALALASAGVDDARLWTTRTTWPSRARSRRCAPRSSATSARSTSWSKRGDQPRQGVQAADQGGLGRGEQHRPDQRRGPGDGVGAGGAAGVLYLASPSAGFVTGVVLDINGGLRYVMAAPAQVRTPDGRATRRARDEG